MGSFRGLRMSGSGRRIASATLLAIVGSCLTVAVAPSLAASPSTKPGAPPTGPARNGALAYGKDGDIWSLDTPSADARLLIGGPEDDRLPYWSPDGTRLMFERRSAGAETWLMVADADGGAVRPVTEMPAYDDWQWLEWAPDGASIGAIRPQAGSMVISLFAVDGTGSHHELQLGDVIPRGWLAFRGPTGKELVFQGIHDGDTHLGFYTIGVDGTNLRPVLISGNPYPEMPFHHAAISPEGDRVSFWSWEDLGDGSNSYIHLLDLVSGEDSVLDLEPAYPRLGLHPQFTPDGASLLFETGPHDAAGGPTNVGGNAQLVIGPLDGSVPARPLGDPYSDDRNTDLSPDGLAVVQTPESGSTVLIDVASGSVSALPDGVRYPSWQRLSMGAFPAAAQSPSSPTTSPFPSGIGRSPVCGVGPEAASWKVAADPAGEGVPDADGRIVFGVIVRDDPIQQQLVSLYAIDPDGTDLVSLLDCETIRPRFSPDGKRLAFGLGMDDGSTQLATMQADGTELRILTQVPGYAETPDWSPDGSWLVYSADPEHCRSYPECVQEDGQRWTLWRIDGDGSDAAPMGAAAPTMMEWEPRVSPDGTEVVYTRIDISHDDWFTPMIRNLSTGEERQVTDDAREPEHPDWTPDGSAIVYNTRHPADAPDASLEQIERVPADDQAAMPTVLYPGDDGHHGFKAAYSPDGSSIVFGCWGALCLMDADGSNVRQLLAVPGVEFNHFDWGRTPVD